MSQQTKKQSQLGPVKGSPKILPKFRLWVMSYGHLGGIVWRMKSSANAEWICSIRGNIMVVEKTSNPWQIAWQVLEEATQCQMNLSFRNVKVADFFNPQVTCFLYEQDPVVTKNRLPFAVIRYPQRKTDGNTSCKCDMQSQSFLFPSHMRQKKRHRCLTLIHPTA